MSKFGTRIDKLERRTIVNRFNMQKKSNNKISTLSETFSKAERFVWVIKVFLKVRTRFLTPTHEPLIITLHRKSKKEINEL